MLRTLTIAVVLLGGVGVRAQVTTYQALYGCFDPNTPSTEWVMPADLRSLDAMSVVLPDGTHWSSQNHPWAYPSAQRSSWVNSGNAHGWRALYSRHHYGPEITCAGELVGYRIEASLYDSEDAGDPPLSAWPSPAKFSGYLDDTVDAADAGYMFRWWNTFVADLTGDEITDAADVGVLFAEWTGDVSPVPEPTVSAWIILAALYSQRRSRR